MARSVRDARLETRAARVRLKPGGKPYYRALDPGLHLGYRKGNAGGRWVMRWYIGEGAYRVETIGSADDKADAGDGEVVLDFRRAQAFARERHLEYTRVAKGFPEQGSPYTVRRCLDEYLAFLERDRKSARDARYRAEALILPQLADLPCPELTAALLRKWLESAAGSAPRLRTRKGEAQKYRDIEVGDPEAQRQRRATANRVLTILKAALNRAWREGKIPSDTAWRRTEPFEEADAARMRYLTIEECRRLINASQGEVPRSGPCRANDRLPVWRASRVAGARLQP